MPAVGMSQATDSLPGIKSNWFLSVQYLGITYHPGGGTTPEVYPLKLGKKAYLVANVGVASSIDYQFNRFLFMRFTAGFYKDCAFVTAGCLHAGPRFQYAWKKNRFDIGIGPIFSFREDWHQFEEYTTDDFYGDRVSGRWQYRFFPTAIELGYSRKLKDNISFQYSLIPGAPLVITSLFGFRFNL